VEPEIAGSNSEQTRSTRRGFLRRAGKTVAIGLGVALVPAARASATNPLVNTYCCRNSSQCGTCGVGGPAAYYCYDSCANTYCCIGCPPNWSADCMYQLPCGACQ
jgi:hypothetical protein